jgi:hypothetical protein
MSQPGSGNGGASGAENGAPSGTGNGGASGAEQPPAWYNTPPAWLNQAPNPAPGSRNDHSGGGSRTDIAQQLAALPDSIVDAIREAFPAPAPATPPPADAGNAPAGSTPPVDDTKTPGQSAGTGGRTKLADWWFGS